MHIVMMAQPLSHGTIGIIWMAAAGNKLSFEADSTPQNFFVNINF